MITFGQLFLAVSIPTIAALIGVLLNHSMRNDIKELGIEIKNFRIEMAKELGVLSTRVAVIETKLGIKAEVKEVAA